MKTPFIKLPLIAIFAVSIFAQSTPSDEMLGFESSNVQGERTLEAKFDSQLNPEDLRTWMQKISARPHHIGSPYNKETADFIASQFRSWGYDTKLEQFEVLFPTPKTRLVEMTAPETFRLKLSEPPVAGDSDVQSAGRAAADIQRLFDRRRCDGAARLRQLRRARRLR